MTRRYQDGDHLRIHRIFERAIHRLASRDYSDEQLRAWAGTRSDVDGWKERCERKRPLVKEIDGEVVGFMELDPDGHIDCTFVDPNHAGLGVMDEIMREVQREAVRLGLRRLHAEVSLTGRAFFERNGFTLIRENVVVIGDVDLPNLLMECRLPD